MNSLCNLCFFLLTAACVGQDTRFAQTYTWLTESKGEHELELKMTRVDRNTWLSENELEFGITNRLTVAPYLNAQLSNQGKTLGGWAVEMRYRFGTLQAKKLLPALYIEPQGFAGDPAVTFEGRVIGTYYPTDRFDSILSGNFVAIRHMAPREPVGLGYSLGYAQLGSANWFGAETYGSWSDGSCFVGPTAGVKLSNDSALIAHLGFSLHRQDTVLKVIYSRGF